MSSTTSPDQNRLPGIRHLVAVGSGKGGDIVDTTDHAAGTKPFYARTG